MMGVEAGCVGVGRVMPFAWESVELRAIRILSIGDGGVV